MKNIYFIIVSLIILVYVINVVRKGKFSVEESFFWVFGSFGALFLSIFPKFFDNIVSFFGIDYPPSLFFLICIIFLLLINFRSSRKIAIQKEKIIELAQQIAIIKSELEEKK